MGILQSLELEFNHDEVEKFLQFFRILCDNFEPLIIKLTTDSAKYKQALQELSVLAHNTAWAARRLELKEVTNLCVFCEELMQKAKEFEGPASDEFADWLLLLSDQFENYCLSYENDAPVLALFNPSLVKMPNSISK